MASSLQGSSTEDVQRAARLRDNKRRNRQRQKDYTASLEIKLKELQSQGVQATKEVQQSARKVVEDNVRLKALLRHLGINDHVIETWTPGVQVRGTIQLERVGVQGDDLPNQEPTPPQTIQNSCWVEHSTLESSRQEPVLSRIVVRDKLGTLESSPDSEPAAQIPCQKKFSKQRSDSTPTADDCQKPSTLPILPPCKVLSRLAQDPSADITQSAPTEDENNTSENDGVECSKAHTMLMQFATTESKLDIISQALERGCVGKEGGGCKVRNEAIWKAMDEVT